MRLLLCLALLAAMACPAIADPADKPDCRAVEYGLKKQAALERIAVLLDSISGGKCRCLIGSAVSANPKLGIVLRFVPMAAEPFITVYLASAAESLQLPDVGWGKVLGAVNLLVPASAPSGEKKAEGGIYLLVYLADAVDRYPKYSTGENCGRVALVTVSVDDKGKTCLREALTVPASRINVTKIYGNWTGDGPFLCVVFPAKGQVSETNPAWRAHIRITYKEPEYGGALDTDQFGYGCPVFEEWFFDYHFALDLEIIML